MTPKPVGPFTDVIEILDGINAAAQALDSATVQAPLTDSIDLIEDAIVALGLVVDIDDAWGAFTTALGAVEAASDALTAFTEIIPYVDVVTSALEAVFDVISTIEEGLDAIFDVVLPIVEDILPILRDILKGLRDIETLIKMMASDLPVVINTMTILSALADIVEVIKPLFAVPGGTSNPVEERLDALYASYEAVNKDISKISKDLGKAFRAISPALDDMYDVGKDIKKICGGTFEDIEKGFNTASGVFSGVESTVKTIENTISPLRKVLHAAESVIKKVVGPIVKAVMHVTGLSVITDDLEARIEKDLGFAALKQFNDFNGSTKSGPHKTQKYSKGNGATGSAAACGMTSNWGLMKEALQDYKRGKKGSAIEVALEALAQAIFNTSMTFEGGPPKIPTTTLKLNVPDISNPPTAAGMEARRQQVVAELAERYGLDAEPPQAADPQQPYRTAAAVMTQAADLIRQLRQDYDDLTALNAAAESALQALLQNSDTVAQAQANLALASQYAKVPHIALTEIGAISEIASDISDIVTKLLKLYPEAVADLEPCATPLSDLATKLSGLARVERALAPIFASAPQTIASANAALTGIAGLPAHAHSCTAIAASASSTAQLMDMLYALDLSLNYAFKSQILGLMSALNSGAVTETAALQQIVSDVRQLGQELQVIGNASQSLAQIYQDLAQWGKPVAQAHLPALLEVAKYINAIDSIVSPLSILLAYAGCKPASGAQLDTSIEQETRTLAYLAGEAIETEAMEALKAVLVAAPKALEVYTLDALNYDQLHATISNAQTGLQANLTALKEASTKAETLIADIAAKVVPARSYPCPGKDRKGAPITVNLDNAFVDEAVNAQMESLTKSMLDKANEEGVPMPDASPLVQQWRKTYDDQ